MRAFRRILLFFLVLTVLFAGCQQAEEKKEEDKKDKEAAEPVLWQIAGLKGPTSIGMVEMMEKHAASTDMNFTVYGAIDELSAKIMSGEVDIAAVPANLASVLYNKSKGKIKVAAINTLGVTAIVEKGEEILSLAELKGKTIAATGKGAVPEATLRLMLAEAHLNPDEDVTIEWKSEPSEVIGWLSAEGNDIAMLPQPFATVATKKVEGLRIALDLSKEWSKLNLPGDFITGVLVVKTELAEKQRDRLLAFLDEYKASIEFSKNSDEAPALVAKYGIIDENVAKIALPSLNIVYMDGEEMKKSLEGYLNLLHQQKPEFVGGTLPDEAFYFLR